MDEMILRLPAIEKRIDATLRQDELAKQRAAQEAPNGVDRRSASGRCIRERWATVRGLPLDAGKGFAESPKLLRIFRLGHVIEDEVVALLESAGYFIEDQQLEVGEYPWIGHIDGVIHIGEDVPKRSLLEVKSANAARFELLREVGYQRWSEGYFLQLQAYMMHLPGIEDAVVAVYCKDTSELYFERVLFDVDVARRLEAESSLVTSESSTPPKKPKAATSQFCKFCKWCDRNAWCWSPATAVEFDE